MNNIELLTCPIYFSAFRDNFVKQIARADLVLI